MLLLPQPFEERRHMDLVRLVIAGERIHDEVDAEAFGRLALKFAAGLTGIAECRGGVPGGTECRAGMAGPERRWLDQGAA